MPVLTKDLVEPVMLGGASTRMDVDVAPNFKVGDKIKTKN